MGPSRLKGMKANLPVDRSLIGSTHRLALLLLVAALGAIPDHLQGATLGEALNATNLTWTTSGTGSSFGWSTTTTSPHDGVSCATSGTISGSSTSTVQATVTGPGTLTF